MLIIADSRNRVRTDCDMRNLLNPPYQGPYQCGQTLAHAHGGLMKGGREKLKRTEETERMRED